MIRIVLLGRTGNHLFQYALGRVLAEKHGVPLVLDGSWFNREGWCEVSHFLRLPLKARVTRRCSLAARALRKFTGKHYWEYLGAPVLRENPVDQSYDPSFFSAPADCVLFGYFQTFLYFENIAEEIRKELRHLIAAGTPVIGTPDVGSETSVAVHVRRGDYLSHPLFQVCGEDYYLEAMWRMRGLIPGAKFHIFSDDPSWCRRRFRDADQSVVDSGSAASNPLHDLSLMARASHHIISNSTYSWWAAWLAGHPGQRVMMPDRWYATDEIIAPVSEKRLPGWETIATRP